MYDPHKYIWGGLSLDYYDHSTSPLYITLQSSQIEGRVALDIIGHVTEKRGEAEVVPPGTSDSKIWRKF